MQYIDTKKLRELIDNYDQSREMLKKNAFVPGAGAPPPQGDPNAMPPGGGPPPLGGMPPGPPPPGGMPPGPPMDPSMMGMPPGGGPPPPGGMPPGGAPPMDPGMMPPGGGPPPPGGGGGVQPEVEGALADLAGGMDQLAQTAEAQQQQTEQLSKRMLDIEQRINEKDQEDKMKDAAPFEGSTKNQQQVALQDLADGV